MLPCSGNSRPELSDIFIVSEEFELPTVSLSEYIKLLQPFYPRLSREVLDRCLDAFELPRDRLDARHCHAEPRAHANNYLFSFVIIAIRF